MVPIHVATLSKIFKPAAPTDDIALFQGRRTELRRLLTATGAVGQHAIVFGERGVGKTSLSYMARDAFINSAAGVALSVRLGCTAEDDFRTVWGKFPGRLTQAIDKLDEDLRVTLQEVADRVEDILMEDPTPEIVGRSLSLVSAQIPLLVLIDEFDRLNAVGGQSAMFADLIKLISDDLVPCTLILVGVADDVGQLVAGHASVDRCLMPVHMPRMTREELSAIVTNGFAVFRERSGLPIEIEDAAAAAISRLSQGFPYFAHLLASAVGQIAIESGNQTIRLPDVFTALIRAQEDAEPSIKTAYYNATLAARSDATFEQTLVAVALAAPDAMGFVTATTVRPALESILHTTRRNSDFNAHLRRFSEDHPIILERDATKRAARYRFVNPLMKPYCLMRGLSSRMINLERI